MSGRAERMVIDQTQQRQLCREQYLARLNQVDELSIDRSSRRKGRIDADEMPQVDLLHSVANP